MTPEPPLASSSSTHRFGSRGLAFKLQHGLEAWGWGFGVQFSVFPGSVFRGSGFRGSGFPGSGFPGSGFPGSGTRERGGIA